MLGRKKKPLYAPALNDLPAEEKNQAIAAIMMLKLSATGLRKFKVSPIKNSLDFEALVARVAGPDIGHADKQDPDELFRIVHCLRDGGTVLSGSPVTDGPYGDVFYRVTVAWSAVAEQLLRRRAESVALPDPTDTVPPPHLREFLDEAVGRYADALTHSALGTWPRAFPATLKQLAESFDSPPELVAAAAEQGSLAERLHGPGWQLGYADLFDMTRDEQLAGAVTQTEPV